MIPVNAIPDETVITANEELVIADPGSLRVTLKKCYCIIFIFRDFQREPDRVRLGSEVDARRLEKTFKHLGADVLTFHNYTKANLRKEFRRLNQKLDGANYDHIVVVIMSHCNEGTFRTFDALDPTDPEALSFKIDDMTATPRLAGKPKIIMINNCWGHI